MTHLPVCRFHRRTVSSSVDASRYLPFSENLTADTGGLSSSTIVLTHLPVATSQMRLHNKYDNILAVHKTIVAGGGEDGAVWTEG